MRPVRPVPPRNLLLKSKMSPPRRSKSGLNYRTWIKGEAVRSVLNYKKRTSPSSGSHKSPKTAASLMRLRARAGRAVGLARYHNEAVLARNIARVKKMLKEIANYEARRRHLLVQQPNKSFALARRN